MNVVITVEHGQDFGYVLVVNAYANGVPAARIAALNVDDPILNIRLRDILEAFDMGTQYGTGATLAPEHFDPTYQIPIPVRYADNGEEVRFGQPDAEVAGWLAPTDVPQPEMAGSDLPKRDVGMADTAIIQHPIQHHAR